MNKKVKKMWIQRDSLLIWQIEDPNSTAQVPKSRIEFVENAEMAWLELDRIDFDSSRSLFLFLPFFFVSDSKRNEWKKREIGWIVLKINGYAMTIIVNAKMAIKLVFKNESRFFDNDRRSLIEVEARNWTTNPMRRIRNPAEILHRHSPPPPRTRINRN